MDTYQVINKVIDYIENNIRSKISLDKLSHLTFVSKYHLHRIFSSHTKITLGRYIKNRKLSLSINHLLNSNMRIADIAYEYGFDYEQSYIRSFINLFHMSPTQFRLNKPAVTITDRMDLNMIKAIENGIISVIPSITFRPEFYVIGIKHIVYQDDNHENNTANHAALDFFHHHSGAIPNIKKPGIFIGLSRYKHITHNESTYLPSLEVTCLSHIPEGMNSDIIPNHKYAVFKYTGLHSPNDITINTLGRIYSFIHEWFSFSSYTLDDNFHFELIDTQIASDDYCEVDVYIPIKSVFI